MGHPKVNEGLPWWLNGKEPTCQCRRYGFDPWNREIPQEKEKQSIPVFMLGKSHGHRSLAGVAKKLDMT